MRALKQRGVPVAGVDRMVLTDQLAVEDLIALGQFLLLPEDELTLATVLKARCSASTRTTLFALAHGRGGGAVERAARRAASAGLRRRRRAARRLLARADFVPPYELFAEVLGARRRRGARCWRGSGPTRPTRSTSSSTLALAYEREPCAVAARLPALAVTGEVEIKRDLDQREPRRGAGA